MQLFRIADRRHPLWDGTGAALVGGRWNSPGRPVIYASTSYACALLEVLVHTGIGRVPKSHSAVIADIPEDVVIQRAKHEALPARWSEPDSATARAFGDAWLTGRTGAVLLVPSALSPYDWNALVNPSHPDAARIKVAAPVPVAWDPRLFER